MELKSCCGCWSLLTGTIFIGIIQIIGGIIMLVFSFVNDSKWETFLGDVTPDTAKIFYGIYFCIAIVLLVGVFKRNTVYIEAWLNMGFTAAVIVLISIICTSITYFQNLEVARGMTTLIGGMIGLVIFTYLWLIVNSLFKQLKNDRTTSRTGQHGDAV